MHCIIFILMTCLTIFKLLTIFMLRDTEYLIKAYLFETYPVFVNLIKFCFFFYIHFKTTIFNFFSKGAYYTLIYFSKRLKKKKKWSNTYTYIYFFFIKFLDTFILRYWSLIWYLIDNLTWLITTNFKLERSFELKKNWMSYNLNTI